MDPYVANQIPPTDLHADTPLYGRYLPRPSDFQVDPQHINGPSPESLHYRASVLGLCDEIVRIYPADEGGRDAFALESVIVKSSHLHGTADGRHEIDYSYADANEVQAISLARSALEDVRMPEIHFAGKANGRQVLVQEKLPGVALAVTYPYLHPTQKESFKQQARQILRVLHAIKLPSTHQARNHVVPDPNIPTNDRIAPLEAQLLFSGAKIDSDVGFVHNNFSTSDIIVGDDWIVGLVGWEVAGFFSWKTAGEVHSRIRTPQSENFVNAGLSEETLRDTMRWNDLYHDGTPESK